MLRFVDRAASVVVIGSSASVQTFELGRTSGIDSHTYLYIDVCYTKDINGTIILCPLFRDPGKKACSTDSIKR